MISIDLLDISVVIPCFRCSATIERAIESVMLQEILPREIILIDDASNDGTLDDLRKRIDVFSSSLGIEGARSSKER